MRRALLAALLVVVAGSVLLRPGERDERRASAVPPRTAGGGDEAAPSTAETDFPPSDEPRPGRPRSLRGTRTDGGLARDADGHFVPTLEARRLFDYFLTATGEISPTALRARIDAEIARRLPEGAAAEASAVLDRYLAYRERVRDLVGQDEGDLDERFATLVALRREVLGGEAAEAFFAEEEAEARTLLETRRIATDPSLTPDERGRRVEAAWAALEADLPPATREARATARLADTLRRAEEEIRTSGGGTAEVQALRERLAGPEAAARLAQLDQRRADWSGRVAVFRAARARLAEDTSLAPEERTAAVNHLLAESFTPAEQLRVQALDRLATTP